LTVKARTDPKLDRIMKFLTLEGEITAGVHAVDGAAAHDSGPSIIEIAEQHEFGLGVPQRSFLRAWFDENRDEIEKRIVSEFQRAMTEGQSHDWAANRLALWLQASIQRRIRNRIAPPLHPRTIAQKTRSGSPGPKDVPLIDTGVLKSAILAYWKGKAVQPVGRA